MKGWIVVLSILAVAATLYGSYWCFKAASYELFYEDMVRATVHEMVRPEALKARPGGAR